MAATGGDKCIGSLYLDISQVKKDIQEVNEWLGKIGANINLEDKLSKSVSVALQKLVNEAKKAGEEAQKAISKIGSGSTNNGISTQMEHITSTVKTYVREVDEAGNATMRLSQTVQTGINQAGNTIKEFADNTGSITKRTEEVKRSLEEEEELAWKAYESEKQAEEAKANAAIEAAYKRDQAAQQAAERSVTREQERADKEVAAMEDSIARQDAALEKQITSYEQAEERKRQAAISAEFDREEARKKAAQAEEETIAKELAMMDEAVERQKQDLDKQVSDYEEAEERKRQAAISAEFDREDARKKALQAEEAAMAKELAMMDEAIAKEQQMFQDNKIREAESAYKNLTTAINNYNTAKKAHNEEGMALWQNEINKQMEIIEGIEKTVGSLNIEESAREQIVRKIQEAKTLQDGFTKGVVGGATATSELEMQMTGLLTRMFSIMAVIRTINNLISNTVEYVSAYYDKMNEIQMITLKTDKEVADLADKYRDIAEMMNVSSLDMADAAIYFTRQGLGAEEIEKRLKNVTMYAKAANVEFTQASEIITAVVNSMGLVDQELEDGRNSAQRVADVFLKVGDSAATSGQEIGEAMQKAAASAGAFGMSFEWLAAYIATVSETTRQEARTIGTALNTIIARLHQIKQNGYNSEDETRINDVQKALAKIGVTLMDNNNEWRDMDTIFQEIGDKWGELDGKTKSYIATTMAGVKQQNVFLALMNDLGKHSADTVEEGSRAWELYTKAIESAGTAEEKYAVYKDSVTASQERLNIAQEKFYSMLDANVIKEWNDVWADYINMIATGADKLGSWTIVLPVVIGLVTTLAIAIKSAGTASEFFATVWEKHPVLIAIAAGVAVVTALVTAITALGNAIETQEERFNKANQTLTESNEKLQNYISLQGKANKMFEELGDEDTNKTLEDYNSLLDELGGLSTTARKAVDDLKDGFISQEEAARQVNEELEKYISKQREISMLAQMQKLANTKEDKRLVFASDLLKSGITNDIGLGQLLNNIVGDNITDEGMKQFVNLYDFVNNDELQELITQYESVFSYIEDTNEKWYQIGRSVWKNYFDGAESSSDYIQQSVQSIINESINAIGIGYDDRLKDLLKSKLEQIVYGEDGVLSPAEAKEYTKQIQKFIGDIYANGISEGDIALLNIEDIFGDTLLDGTKDAIKYMIAHNSEWAGSVNSALEELFAAGIDKDRIQKVLTNLYVDQWGNAVIAMRGKILTEISKITHSPIGDMDEQGNQNMLMWTQLDVATLEWVKNLIAAGTSLEDVKKVMRDSDSVDAFIAKMQELYGELGEDIPDGAEAAEEAIRSISNIAKSAKSEISSLDKVIKEIKNGKTIKFSDLLDIANSHPEILQFTKDTDTLIKRLESIKKQTKKNAAAELYQNLLNNEEFIKSTKYNEIPSNSGGSYQTLKDLLAEMPEMQAEIDTWLKAIIDDFLNITDDVEETTDEVKDFIKEIKTAKADYKKLQDLEDKVVKNGKVSLDDVIDFADTHPKLLQIYDDVDALIAEIERLKKASLASVAENYTNYLLHDKGQLEALRDMSDEEVANMLLPGEEGAGIVRRLRDSLREGLFDTLDEYRNWLVETGQDTAEIDQYITMAAEAMEEAAEKTEDAAETWLQAQEKILKLNDELNWAKSNNYIEQLNQIIKGEAMGPQGALDAWNNFSEEMKTAITKEYPNIAKAMAKIEQQLQSTDKRTRLATDGFRMLGVAVRQAKEYATTNSFDKINDDIKKLTEGTISATEAYEDWSEQINKVTKAHEDINDVTQKIAQGKQDEVTESDVNNLSALIGISADQILADFPAAVAMFDDLIGKGGELETMFNRLNEAAFLKITGTAVGDFSELQDGIITTKNMAKDMIDLLIATGQWTVEEVPLKGDAWVWHDDGKWYREFFNSSQQILKPASNNPYKGTSATGSRNSSNTKKKSGGGGGGNKDKNSKKPTTEVEIALDRMSQVNAIQEYQQGFYQSEASYYAQTGQLQGVIGYNQREIGVLQNQNKTLRSNISTIERYLDLKKKELASLSSSDEAYEEVRDDVEKLQKAHQTYTKQLVDNDTAIDKLTKSIKEQHDKIRDMEIDLRQTIYKAIEDREKKRTDMLNAEIEMENKILDLIKKRYEKERDQIVQTTNMKIDALKQERDLLSEQLELRKKQAEEEDKAKKLLELEKQYQRIIADPTRAKEAQEIRKNMTELREEMAWDAAEAEVESQQKSIDQQVESLEDYIDQVEEYYEDLFEHPQKLIEEMESIMQQTDDEILAWLKENDEEYAKATKNRQESMVEGWKNTMNDMRGIVQTYWDEVESIIAQGDEYIINFLISNSADYAAAGKLQAEKYVEEWQKKLDDLKKAHEEVATVAASTYSYLEPSSYSSGSSGGGGGGGKSTKYSFVYLSNPWNEKSKQKTYKGYKSAEDAQKAIENLAKRDRDALNKMGLGYTVYEYWNKLINENSRLSKSSITAYKKGGYADFTGPAWMDGSKQEPEAVLNPYQTKLFESMVAAMEQMSKVQIPTMPSFGDIDMTGGGTSVGDIIVNVENLDTDDDYETLAKKVSEILMERIGRTTVVGGLRIN